tara:strand:+ start:121 stop:324 length:204 start_codon:yes stop_codon:yes gene_type:complete
MGTTNISWCDNCGTVATVSKYWQQTDSQKRSTEHTAKSVDLCSSCLVAQQINFDSLLKYLSAPLDGI